MEDALAPGQMLRGNPVKSLDPCCNGRCTRTWSVKETRSFTNES